IMVGEQSIASVNSNQDRTEFGKEGDLNRARQSYGGMNLSHPIRHERDGTRWVGKCS
ncbi:hypothetical protein HAX54_049947, partial [Datura stramonium]|nr:hypothetical protein [Datura stramonium]